MIGAVGNDMTFVKNKDPVGYLDRDEAVSDDAAEWDTITIEPTSACRPQKHKRSDRLPVSELSTSIFWL